MKDKFVPALIAGVATLILAFPLLGLNLVSDGLNIGIEGADTQTMIYIVLASLAVFLFQLFKENVLNIAKSIPLPRKAYNPAVEVSQAHRDKREKLFTIIIVAIALVWPFFASRGNVDLATLVLIYVMLGLGLNIVGAYSYALLHQYFGFSFWVCLPLAGLMAATFGFVLGFPVLRLRGDYLAIVTLGFGEIIRILLNNWTHLTGGPNGIGSIPKPALFGLEFGRRAKEEGNIPFHEYFNIAYNSSYKVIFLYLLALLLVLFTIFVIRRLMRMPVGRAWEALREDEIACRSLGLNRTIIKLSAFTIGASFAGFAGAFFSARQGFISPESFTFIESAIILAIVVLGGMGSQMGVILAAIAMTVLPELAREFQEYRMLMFGLMMVLMMIWRPQGLLPMKRRHMELTNA
jgi:branched-chain amino acid transport system permease protein